MRPRFSIVPLVLLAWLGLGAAQCHNLCSKHGTCNQFSRCECWQGFTGADCSERTCPLGAAWSAVATEQDVAHVQVECSNRGTCDRKTGGCKCDTGFTGDACQRMLCPRNCNGAGTCMSMRKYAQKSRDSLTQSFVYKDVWDAEMIFGCVCDIGYSGHDCSLQECPKGDDPMTTGQVSEVQYFLCQASGGSFQFYFGNQVTATIPASATELQVAAAFRQLRGAGEVSVSFSDAGSAVCNPTINMVRVEFLQAFGPQPPLVPRLTNLILGGGSFLVSGDGVTELVDGLGNAYLGVKGTTESAPCSNRGKCNPANGQCECYDTNGVKYGSSDGKGNIGTRGDCGYAVTPVLSCPGEIPCSGHGACITSDSSFRCECESGWTGGDCSERTCPSAPSWFDYPAANNEAHTTLAECSNRGSCNRWSGACTCEPPFFGGACEYVGCASKTADSCSGHGRCLTIGELAKHATQNGELAPKSYGKDPNNPYTWDAHRIMGCLCDEGYEGFDCSQRSCPAGNDASLYNGMPEIQLVQCIAGDGSVTLSFRDEITSSISFDTTSNELQAILEELPTVDGVQVNYESGFSALCDPAGGNIVQVTFTAVPGNVPALVVEHNALIDTLGLGTVGSGQLIIATDGMAIGGFVSRAGTTTVDTCNNHGICDTFRGQCRCFPGWASSDGSNSYGTFGDCGYRLPVRSNLRRHDHSHGHGHGHDHGYSHSHSHNHNHGYGHSHGDF